MTAARAPLLVASVGYQKATHDQVISWLVGLGVRTVVDVRRTPFSFKRGWSKGPLERALAEWGITYRSEKALGTPAELGRELKETQDFDAFERKWERDVLPSPSVQDRLGEVMRVLLRDGSVALLCMEDDHTQCHRSILVKALAARAARIRTVHFASEAGTSL